MSHPEDEDQEPEQEPTGVEEAQSEEDQDRGPGQVELAAPEERPRDVASVELTGRQEVDRGHEQTDPARECERVRMAEERVRQREEQREGAEQKRRLRLPCEREAGSGRRRGQRESRQGHRNCDRESDKRSRNADIEKRAAIRYRVSHTDERAKRAEGRDRRQEERKRRLHFVSLRDEVVAHLVGAEDRQQRQSEEQAAEPNCLDGEERLPRVVRPVPRPTEERRGEDRDEEQDQVHLRPRETRSRPSLNVDEGLALLLGDRGDVVFRDKFKPQGVEGRVDAARRNPDLERQRHRADDDAVHGKLARHSGPERLNLRLRGEHCASQPSHVLKGAGLRSWPKCFRCRRDKAFAIRSSGEGYRKGWLECVPTLPRVQRGGPDLAPMLAAFCIRYRRRARRADRKGPTLASARCLSPRRSNGLLRASLQPLPRLPLLAPTPHITNSADKDSLEIRHPLYALSTRAVNLVAERRGCIEPRPEPTQPSGHRCRRRESHHARAFVRRGMAADYRDSRPRRSGREAGARNAARLRWGGLP